jgi:hypothetical protein
MGLGRGHHNSHLNPAPYNFQQIIYMSASIHWNYLKMYKNKQRYMASSRYVFSYHPFYFDFHSTRIIFDCLPVSIYGT